MVNCAVAGCKNYTRITKGTEIRYFRFPTQKDLAKQWVSACCRSDKVNLKNACICSVHFEPDCLAIPLRQRLLNYFPKNTRILKNDAVPTLKLPSKVPDKEQPPPRSLRLAIKKRNKLVTEVLSNTSTSTSETTMNCSDDIMQKVVYNRDAIIDIDSKLNINLENEDLRKRILMLENENANLSKQIEQNNIMERRMKNALEKVFTTSQIGKLLNDDISYLDP